MMPQLINFVPIGIPEASPAKWAEGKSFRLPAGMARDAGFVACLNGTEQLDVSCLGKIQPDRVEALRLLRAYTETRPASSRLPFSYQRVPPTLRRLVASVIGRWKRRSVHRWAVFPGWPLDLSADLLADLSGSVSPFVAGPAPVILSHDLDSPEGLSNLVQNFLDIEEAVASRSANYIVPCAWPIDHGLLGEVRARGHEIGIHGYDHSNRTPFAETTERRARLSAATALIERYGITGYRAPSLLRTSDLLADLSQFYAYDSSIPTAGGAFPIPNNGCASARPFSIGRLMELPISLPRDGSLRFLGYRPRQILQLWIDCSEIIASSGGIIVLLTHCEKRFSGNRSMLAAYREFLQYLAESARFAFSSTADVLQRFREKSGH
jgi:peptidoglycan/xylan/chitin deacetylase (PgdA/CDA1 family)